MGKKKTLPIAKKVEEDPIVDDEITEDDIDLDDEKANPDVGNKEPKPVADEEVELSFQQYQIIAFFDIQHAINSLIDFLNQSIEDIIISFSRADQRLFTHAQKKLIMNAVLESGFYDFCRVRLKELMVENDESKLSEEEFEEIMQGLQEEIQLLAYILVNNRLVHRNLNFDLYLSLLKGGLFEDILGFHIGLMKEIAENKENDKTNPVKNKIKKYEVKDKYSFYI